MSAIASYFLDFAYSLTNCVFCFPGSPNLKINSRSFKILRLLGEVSITPAIPGACHAVSKRKRLTSRRAASPMYTLSKTPPAPLYTPSRRSAARLAKSQLVRLSRKSKPTASSRHTQILYTASTIVSPATNQTQAPKLYTFCFRTIGGAIYKTSSMRI